MHGFVSYSNFIYKYIFSSYIYCYKSPLCRRFANILVLQIFWRGYYDRSNKYCRAYVLILLLCWFWYYLYILDLTDTLIPPKGTSLKYQLQKIFIPFHYRCHLAIVKIFFFYEYEDIRYYVCKEFLTFISGRPCQPWVSFWQTIITRREGDVH